jgi:hypothetical protein
MHYMLDEQNTNLAGSDPSEYRLDFKRHAALAQQAADRRS